MPRDAAWLPLIRHSIQRRSLRAVWICSARSHAKRLAGVLLQGSPSGCGRRYLSRSQAFAAGVAESSHNEVGQEFNLSAKKTRDQVSLRKICA